jgi:hypothetical protein
MPKKAKKQNLLSGREFFEKIESEGGHIEALVYYGLPVEEYDIPHKEAIIRSVIHLRKEIDLLDQLMAEVRDHVEEQEEADE